VTSTVELAAHAKVNLLLRVLAREADGYHSLETLFCRISLAELYARSVWRGDRLRWRSSGPILDRRSRTSRFEPRKWYSRQRAGSLVSDSL
jgi:4-diphosphocytidyl-2C-methyl-D-erythritol 2-phosphate synthase